jgi:hypothetical protein
VPIIETKGKCQDCYLVAFSYSLREWL